MKKMLIAAALCAGIVAFASTDFAEASDQKDQQITSIQTMIQGSDTDKQELKIRNDKYDE